MSSEKSALFLTPEAPYPIAGGGAIRSASLLEWLKQRYAVDVITFSPAGIPGARETITLTLPAHSRNVAARAWRNAHRYARGVPPLIDRFRGFDGEIRTALRGKRYDLGVIEHFWCAEYARVLRPECGTLVLDLHNIESELHATGADAATWPVSHMLRRFAGLYRQMERKWLPEFDAVLTTSPDDAARAKALGAARTIVYPNALPEVSLPAVEEQDRIIFSGNFEYEPNRRAVRWFAGLVWPRLRQEFLKLEWWLVGRNPDAVAGSIRGDSRIRTTGPVEEALPILTTAKVCVAPILDGSGTRFKILEAWAAGRAVVSTTLGAEGLGARDGVELLIADQPEAMVAAISSLLRSQSIRDRLGAAGRSFFEERYTWPVAWKALRGLEDGSVGELPAAP